MQNTTEQKKPDNIPGITADGRVVIPKGLRERHEKPGYKYCLSLPEDLAARLLEVAAKRRRSIAQQLRTAIEEHVEQEERKLLSEAAESGRELNR